MNDQQRSEAIETSLDDIADRLESAIRWTYMRLPAESDVGQSAGWSVDIAYDSPGWASDLWAMLPDWYSEKREDHLAEAHDAELRIP